MTPKLQLPHRGYDIVSVGFVIESISTRCRFPVPEEEKQSITEPLPCFTAGSVCFSLPPPDTPLIHRPEKFQCGFIAPQNRIPEPLWLIHIVLSKLEPTFLVLLGQWWCTSRSPSAFSMRLTVETETSEPAAGLLQVCCSQSRVFDHRPPQDSGGSFLFLPRPGSEATVTVSL